ncbi:MAG: S8 family serine peptidase [Pyrinomonadaceae bacterium]|nr:S8 family serine peptidase [Pyrinomonadaceae bacterium]
MKRTILLLSALFILAIAFGGTRALLQQGENPKELGGQSNPSEVQTEALPNGKIGNSNLHKMFVNSDESDVYSNLAGRGAIVREVDYGSFKVLTIDENAGVSRQELSTIGGQIRDEQNLIPLNGYVLDTTDGKGVLDREPTDLRQNKMRDGIGGKGLYIVQFAGPVKDEWLSELNALGGKVVTYVPNNAYVVRANEKTANQLNSFRSKDFVQYVGDYEPAFRLSPMVQEARSTMSGDIDVTVQVIDGKAANQTISNLKEIATEFVSDNTVMGYRNIGLKVDVSHIGEIASMDEVFAVEERRPRQKMDEVQGQIVAGNLTGNLPSGTGYLTWLAGKGFDSTQFGSFSVNVVDDAYTLTGTSQHPDLPAARVPFQNNPTSQTGAQGGHGFLNSHIVAGFNNGTGSANEDANGYNYGVGIAPWARTGVTAIFGNGASTPTAWENTAYGQSSRISTNSWGYRGVYRYDANSQEYDRIVRDAQSGVAGNQQLITVFAAGNDGSGANTVSSPGTAKNVITVGASENVRQTGTDGCAIGNTGADSANDIISFSSRGPVNSTGGDGRVKPEIVAPGTHIEAGIPQANYDGSSVCNQYWPAGQTLYGWSSGTSHSCPAVAGGAALLYQNFINNSLAVPSPALAKAYLMNSATYMSGTGAGGNLPSNSQGMGRMDLGRAFDGTAKIMKDQSVTFGATGNTDVTTATVADTSKPLRVTLAWTDAPGPTTGAPFINNLDLEVTVGGTTYRGNVFSGANSTSGGTADTRNNAESVFLPAGTSGAITVTVRATNIAGDGVPGNADTTDQDFALIVYNATASTPTNPTISVNPSSMSFSGTAGGANPAAQTLNITNSGAGTLNWSATSSQTWLTLSATSGTAPSSPSVSVNTTGLAAGTYNANITITGTGATNSPVTVPVTLTVNPSGGSCTGTQLLANTGFETTASWTLSGATRSTTTPRTGSFNLLSGNANSATHTGYQTVTIPAGCSPNLRFYLSVTSSETTTTTIYDRLFIEVRNTSGTLLTTLATFSNLNKTAATSYVLRGPYNLSAYAGQTVRIQFRATTDSSLTTNFRVDDTSLIQ